MSIIELIDYLMMSSSGGDTAFDYAAFSSSSERSADSPSLANFWMVYGFTFTTEP